MVLILNIEDCGVAVAGPRVLVSVLVNVSPLHTPVQLFQCLRSVSPDFEQEVVSFE